MARYASWTALLAVGLLAALSPSATATRTILEEDSAAVACPANCPSSWQGDGVCDDSCNVEACNYDNGDCEKCDDNCYKPYVGDGYCNMQCMTEACGYDGGDCDSLCSPGCQATWPGDGVCDDLCNIEACNFDNGDCKTCDEQKLCFLYLKGDGFCDRTCFNSDCEFDGGDCTADTECAPGCQRDWIGDHICDASCNVTECEFDHNDCDPDYRKFIGADYVDGQDYMMDVDFDAGQTDGAADGEEFIIDYES